MVNSKNKDRKKRRIKQGRNKKAARAMKIGPSTPFGYTDEHLTPYGGLLPLEKFLDAVRSENVGAMQDILLGGKVDLFGEDKLGAKALNEAVVLGHTEIVNILLNNGVDINGTNNGFWPLGIACKKGNDFMAEHLVEKGADVNQ